MSLEKRILEDYVQAMKSKDTVKSATLSFLRAQLKNVLIDLKVKELADGDVIGVIKKQIKQRQDSIDQYTKGGRMDLVEKEQAEMAVLKSYLPPEMSESGVREIVAAVISETKPQGLKDMGNVMKTVMARVAGQADGKLVSTVVKEELGKL